MGEVHPVVHLVAGGVGGTVGAIVTCPLDVVKTRLQSSKAQWHQQPVASQGRGLLLNKLSQNPFQPFHSANNYSTSSSVTKRSSGRVSIIRCLRYIFLTEGTAGLFRGLGPNLVGVAPTRALYFCAYAKSKEVYSRRISPNKKSVVHLLSAGTAGFAVSTITNPLWFLKTRLQLDSQKGKNKLTLWRCISKVYSEAGLKGFYRGLTASYAGICETVLHFVIYEKLKEKIIVHGRSLDVENDRTPTEFAEFFLASALSKTLACVTFYPHEVARTRMREEGSIYRGFFSTLSKVALDEGWQGLYKGLFTQLVRAIPNTAIMMATYEITVYCLTQPSQPEIALESDADEF